jgi:electron transport complex protein RnfB
VPGGESSLKKLIEITNHPVDISLDLDFGPGITNQKAFIIEDECIGCKKCIDACPIDAIHGASNLMHSVIDDLCTGCELCVPPCPVDCIELVQVNENDSLTARNNSEEWFQNTIKLRQRRIKERSIVDQENNLKIGKEINEQLNNRSVDKEKNIKQLQRKILMDRINEDQDGAEFINNLMDKL